MSEPEWEYMFLRDDDDERRIKALEYRYLQYRRDKHSLSLYMFILLHLPYLSSIFIVDIISPCAPPPPYSLILIWIKSSFKFYAFLYTCVTISLSRVSEWERDFFLFFASFIKRRSCEKLSRNWLWKWRTIFHPTPESRVNSHYEFPQVFFIHHTRLA